MRSDLAETGCCAGPLFAPPRLTREPCRPPEKAGLIHRAQTRRATPPWADCTAIRAVYAEAHARTRKEGELWVVDHIVPKISRWVCGLHVPANLRVIHWRENAIKANNHWPDMWAEQGELF